MKKVLALFLVLGLATVSSAAIELGIGQLGVREIGPLQPSDEIIIVLGDPQGGPGVTNFLGIKVDGPGSFVLGDPVGSGVVIHSPPVLEGAPGFAGYFGPDQASSFGYNEIVGIDTAVPGVTANGAGIWAEILFHCDGPGDVIIDLMDDTLGVIIDTVIVHQIPEPMTMSLLALGGLGLIRRRRA